LSPSPSPSDAFATIVDDVLRAKGTPAEYLPTLSGWTRSRVDAIGSADASATYAGLSPPAGVRQIDVLVSLYPSESRAQAALDALLRRYRQVINLCVAVPTVGCVSEDVQERWLGFGFAYRTAVIDVRLTSESTIPLTSGGALSPRFRQLDEYLQSFASAYAARLP